MTRIFCSIFSVLFGAVLYAQHPGAQFPGYPGAPVQGYYQAVKIRGPEGTQVALSVDEKFIQRQTMPYAVGLLVGSDYRLRITDIPFQPGKEVFPTVKIIARTYPPQGLELEYPIQIDITQEDIELALDGKFVTRVIYLENPQTAMPIRGDLGTQISTDTVPGADPIAVAATMGQPVAVVRIGGRIPNTLGAADPMFFLGSPPWTAFDKTPEGRYEMTLYQSRMPVMIGSRPTIPLR
jgi:hypothetical protein